VCRAATASSRSRAVSVSTSILSAGARAHQDQTGIIVARKGAAGAGKVPMMFKFYGKAPLPSSGAQTPRASGAWLAEPGEHDDVANHD
jgi:hypothetical protein